MTWLPRNLDKFSVINDLAEAQLKKRMESGSGNIDLFHFLGSEDKPESERPSYDQIESDSSLVLIAGSDTTATALGSLFFYLLSSPLAYRRLQDEIDENFPLADVDSLESTRLAKLPFFNAVMYVELSSLLSFT